MDGSTHVTFALTPAEIISTASCRRKLPKRKQRVDSCAFQLPLAIAPDVFEKKIAKRDGLNSLVHRSTDERAHQILVLSIRAGPRQFYRPQRQPSPRSLGFGQGTANRMHRDTIRGAVEGRDQAYNIDTAVFGKNMQRPGAVLSGAPGYKDLSHCARSPHLQCIFSVGVSKVTP